LQTMSKPLIQLRDLQISFPAPDGLRPVLQPLSIDIHDGELLALVGESGSGKSITALAVLQLLPPSAVTSGQVIFQDNGAAVDLLNLEQHALENIRGRRIGMIFQEPMTALNPVITCGQQVAEVLQRHMGLSRAQARKSAIDWLRRVKLPDPEKLFYRYPHQLSGGQKQRVMIALAICCKPALLICDEPTTALDVTVQRSILVLIRELQQELGMAVLFITHDLGVVADIADSVAVLYQGELVEHGSDVLRHPVHPYTKALLACRPANHPKDEPLPMVRDFLEGKPISLSVVPLPKPSSEPYVEIRDLVVQFPVRTNIMGRVTSSLTAVDGVSLDIFRGETLGLVGESGCGKTTLGRALLGLIKPASGNIRIGGRSLEGMKPADWKEIRRSVQLVFQDPYAALNPRLTISEALEEPLLVTGTRSRSERRSQVLRLLNMVGLPQTAASRYPHAFSGGQRQRLVIARALTLQPSLLVCDESVSALDVSVQAQVLNLLNELRRELSLTLLFISHDLSVVRYLSDRIAVMQAGRIVEIGHADEVYHFPKNAYTQALLAAIPGKGQ
jgi:peptide/nickel transport system ATP-binding protein